MPFGIGAAPTLDEFELLLGRDNPYWGGEQLALAQRAAAGVAAAALALAFHRSGSAADCG